MGETVKQAKDAPEKQKLTYEELEQAANQLLQVNQQMQAQLRQQDFVNFHQRMTYLFDIIKLAEHFPKAFIKKCTDEVETVITLLEEDPEDKEEDVNKK